MLNIEQKKDGTNLEIALSGRLDTTTVGQLEEVTNTGLAGITELVFNLAELEYISSAGLRVLLASQKVMNKQGSMVVTNVKEEVNEIFEVTGFSDILTIR